MSKHRVNFVGAKRRKILGSGKSKKTHWSHYLILVWGERYDPSGVVIPSFEAKIRNTFYSKIESAGASTASILEELSRYLAMGAFDPKRKFETILVFKKI